VRETKCKTISL